VQAPGAVYQYIALNMQDPTLRNVAVRRALALAIDRRPMIEYLWRNQARPASSVLPPNHWAFCPDATEYPHDPARARALLDTAGFPPGRDGVRLRLTMKTSTEETSRLLAAVVQQQLREVGVAVELRSNEFATFYSDIVKGAFQMYTLRWIRANNDPDIFEYCFHSRRVPPNGANRGRYFNPRLDDLLDASRTEMDQGKRQALLFEVQRILNDELPYLHLWYYDNVVVHSDRLADIAPTPGGDYDFLKTV
jgi:peptide/nickel transport system substrate-binding protein